MRARVEIEKRESKRALTRIWNAAALTGAAFAGKLKPLDHYLETEDQSRGGIALLGALRAMKRKGVPMTIERIGQRV